jgi:predicted dehydrogenase
MKTNLHRTSRRHFIKTAGALAAGAAAAPAMIPWSACGAEAPGGPLRMGFVGMGYQSRALLGGFLGSPNTRVVAVCDVDTTRRDAAKQRVNAYYADAPGGAERCDACNDFRDITRRKDIDAVCIATPDHWHAIVTLAALRGGKDVYCEKPLTHNIQEAIEILRAVDEHGRVLQTGSMQRSMKEFRVACELVLNGAIGRVQRVECGFGGPAVPCDLGEEAMEPGLDWDRWLGPAPDRPYHSDLSPRGVYSFYPHWRKYREYGGGAVTDWGAHHLDIAQWGLGMDGSGSVEALPPDQPGATHGAKLVYANGVTVEHTDGSGVHFFGTDGAVMVNRGKFVFTRGKETIASFTGRDQGVSSCQAEVAKAEEAFLKDAKIRLYVSRNHIGDFLDCVRSRKKPITNEQAGGRSAICCHLVNLCYYHGQKLDWDPKALAFAHGTGDPQWLTREYRAPWRV